MSTIGENLEESFFPYPVIMKWNNGEVKSYPLSTAEKVKHIFLNAVRLIATIFSIPFIAIHSLVESLISRLQKQAPAKIELPLAKKELTGGLPEHFGFADSLFQTSGLGTKASPTQLEGLSNWDAWLDPSRIEGTEDGDYQKFFVDVLNNPRPYVDLLREMGVTAHRFSLEWSIIEPEKGKLDEKAIELYRNLIRELQEAGIEPYVTLHHFVSPKWFEPTQEASGFDSLDHADYFVEHALRMIELFPEVTNWMTFNELGVVGMQTCLRGDYPPGLKGHDAENGRVIRNLLIAHCKIYKAVKEKYGDAKQIGITHQWLKFLPLEGNFVERLICHYFSKNHNAIYNFFKTGHFAYQVAGKANVQFSIPKEEFLKQGRFIDFLGVQAYGFPRLKAGFNGGEDYPGYKTVNVHLLGKHGLAFGTSCHPGEKMMSFGPRYTPTDLEHCLREAVALDKPIVISETGCDANIQAFGDSEFRIDNQTQKNYYEKALAILKKFQGHIKAFFAWTLLRGHLEWNRGQTPCLGVVEVVKDAQRNIIGHRLSPAAELLQKVFKERSEQLQIPLLQIAQ